MKKFQAIRGMNDILPDDVGAWQFIESILRELAASYCYREIRFPILESLDLFCRTLGDVTDIVEKEMYAFEDRNGDRLALRPEGTAGCVRAAIENGIIYNQTQRLWYTGPMFRHERPQKGRYRQFHQFGLEAFGFAGPDIDAEIILFSADLWQRLGLSKHLELQINSLGTAEIRKHYRDALVSYLTQYQQQLDEDSQRRLTTNPLRILDSKNPALAEIIAGAPKLLDYLDEESREHFQGVCQLLDTAGIAYTVNPTLVRGLDYYSKTVFEWVTTELGAQGTVCAGGRYDALVEQLGGHGTPGIGFAMGIERLLELVKLHAHDRLTTDAPHAYMILMGDLAKEAGFKLSHELRQAVPGLRLITHCGPGSFKNQFKKADKSAATLALVLGDEEIQQGQVAIKYLREDKPQENCDKQQLIALLNTLSGQESSR